MLTQPMKQTCFGKLLLLFSIVLLFIINTAQAQTYSIVIKGGHIIDPRNNINGVMDLAINGDECQGHVRHARPYRHSRPRVFWYGAGSLPQ
jgi:hypothetical protein